MADDAGHAEPVVVEQRAGQLLVLREIGAHEARDVIDVAADLPALDDVVDRGQPLFEAAAIGLLLQDDLGKDVDRPRQPAKLDDGVIARDDARGFKPPHALERRPRRQPDRLRQLLDGGASVALQGGENPDVDVDPMPVDAWRP